MLLGLVRPTSGRATVHGLLPGDPVAVARTGSLVEGPGFYPYLSGRENLRVLSRYRGLGDREVDQVLERVDLTERGGDRFKTYSLGMKQRLGVAAALLGEPDLLVLDEPTNGLDPAGMADMRALLVDVAAGGQTVLLSSHLLAEVQEICDRVGIIAGGRLLVESTVSDLRGATGIRLVADPVDRALAVAMSVAGDDAVEVEGSVLRVSGPAAHAPELARALVGAGVDIAELTPVERSLEDVFFDLTRTVTEEVPA
jgi:ABC-2 type transport system ATP-binding protein